MFSCEFIAPIEGSRKESPSGAELKISNKSSQSLSQNLNVNNRLILRIDLKKAQLALNKNTVSTPQRNGIPSLYPCKAYYDGREDKIAGFARHGLRHKKRDLDALHYSSASQHKDYHQRAKKIFLSIDKSSVQNSADCKIHLKKSEHIQDRHERNYSRLYVSTTENKHKRIENGLQISTFSPTQTHSSDVSSGEGNSSSQGAPSPASRKEMPHSNRDKKQKKTWNSKKKDPYDVYRRVVSSLKQRDHYGFFLKPVDTSVFTDYTSVISNPMDLGRMNEKVINREYTSLSELRDDLELLVSNAKKYNSTDSAYHKSASRLWEWGSRLIDKVTESLAPEQPQPFQLQAVQATSGRTHVKRRRKLLQELELRLRSARNSDYTPKSSPKIGTKSYDVFSSHISKNMSSFMNSVHLTTDFSIDGYPLALSIHTYSLLPQNEQQRHSTAQISDEILDVYGGSPGLAYAQSLERFTKNLRGIIRDECWKNANYSTKGCYNVLRKSAQLLSNDIQLSISSITKSALIETEYGSIDLASMLGGLNSKILEPFRTAQIEHFRLNGIDATPLATPILQKPPNADFAQEIDTLPLDEMLKNNILDIATYLQSTQDTPLSSPSYTGTQLMERIRRRLLILVKKVSPSKQLIYK